MKSYWIAPSILSADLARLGEEVDAVLAAGADWIHFDVMDQHYVPNLTLGPFVLSALRKHGVKAPIDVHLMSDRVDPLIQSFAEAGASAISFHPEATDHVDRSLQLIKDKGLKAGLALNPATSLDCLTYVWDKLDFVLIMTVNPGFAGQPFQPNLLTKIAELRARINAVSKEIRIEVDGGVSLTNIADLAQAGADMFVAGSAIFQTPDYAQTIAAMRDILSKVI